MVINLKGQKNMICDISKIISDSEFLLSVYNSAKQWHKLYHTNKCKNTATAKSSSVLSF